MKSVKSRNQCQSVIQTISDITQGHNGEMKVETLEGEGLPAEALAQAGSKFIVIIPSIQ